MQGEAHLHNETIDGFSRILFAQVSFLEGVARIFDFAEEIGVRLLFLYHIALTAYRGIGNTSMFTTASKSEIS